MSDRVDLRLAAVEIAGYGRLAEQAFELGPAGAVVHAPNESGKSTLASAVFRGLFGFDDKAREQARRPWGGGPFEVALRWSLDDDRTCLIRRDFDTHRVVVEWRSGSDGDGPVERRWEGEPNPRGRSADRDAYAAELERLLGFSSPEIFRQTVFVGPGGAGVRPLETELLRLVSGTERADFRAALETLETGWYELTTSDLRDPARKAKHKPRRLELLDEERRELERGRRETRDVDRRRAEAEAELAEVQGRIEASERRLEEGREGVDAVRRLAEIRGRVGDAEERLGELDEAVRRFTDWEASVRRATTELEPLVRYLKVADDFVDRLDELARLEEERERIVEERDAVREILDGPRSRGPLLVLVMGALVGLVGGVAWGLGLAPVAGAGAAAAGAGLVLLAAWAHRRRRAARDELVIRRGQLEGRLGVMLERRRALAEELEIDPDAIDPAAERERHDRAVELRARLDGMQEAHAALGDREAIETERKRIKAERLDVLRLEESRILDAHPYLAADDGAPRRVVLDQKRLAEERDRLVARELELRRTLADLPEAARPPRAVADRLAEIEAEAERVGLELDAYRLAHATLTACRDEFVGVMVGRIERRLAGLFRELTDERYRAVAIDPETFDLQVDGVERTGVPAASLSRGALDQLRFALRVAVVEVMAVERALPLVLDDPFLHYDPERLASVEGMLARLSERHQILVLTHDRRIADWKAFPRIELDGAEVAGHPVSKDRR